MVQFYQAAPVTGGLAELAESSSLLRNRTRNSSKGSNPLTSASFKKVIKMIPKSELKVGTYYRGHCRNASLARWNGTVFIYIRCKFGHEYPESINHEEDFNDSDEL